MSLRRDLRDLGLILVVFGALLGGLAVILTPTGAWPPARETTVRQRYAGGNWQGDVWVRCEAPKGWERLGLQSRYYRDGRVHQTNQVCWDVVVEDR